MTKNRKKAERERERKREWICDGCKDCGILFWECSAGAHTARNWIFFQFFFILFDKRQRKFGEAWSAIGWKETTLTPNYSLNRLFETMWNVKINLSEDFFKNFHMTFYAPRGYQDLRLQLHPRSITSIIASTTQSSWYQKRFKPTIKCRVRCHR